MQEMWEMLVLSLGQENPLEEEMATHSSILAWRILWTEEPGGLQPKGSQRIRHDLATEHACRVFLQKSWNGTLHKCPHYIKMVTHPYPQWQLMGSNINF